jgi:hypothetical protein
MPNGAFPCAGQPPFLPSRFEGLIGAYHQSLTTGARLPITVADARCSLELVTELYRSAAAGSVVALPIERDHPKYNGWRGSRDQ